MNILSCRVIRMASKLGCKVQNKAPMLLPISASSDTLSAKMYLIFPFKCSDQGSFSCGAIRMASEPALSSTLSCRLDLVEKCQLLFSFHNSARAHLSSRSGLCLPGGGGGSRSRSLWIETQMILPCANPCSRICLDGDLDFCLENPSNLTFC
jgi:hypothetical protein